MEGTYADTNTTNNELNDDLSSDYCDDFEEYESDFEEEEPDERSNASITQPINGYIKNTLEPKAMLITKNLNERIESKVQYPFNTAIDSVKSVKIRSEFESKRNISVKRSKELLEIIKLDKISLTNLDLPPINYDLFIKTFGRRDAKQVSCQTIDREDSQTQTDSLNMTNKWTQNPSFSRMVSGNEQQLNDNEICATDSVPKVNPFLLIKFLNKAEAVMSAIIGSEFTNNTNKRSLPKGAEKLSTNLTVLKCLSLAKKCPISYTFTNSLYLFCVQNVSKTVGSAEKSVISVWNLLSRREPEKVLICRSHINSAFSDQNLVVGAMIDGSVALWDLNEQSYCHKHVVIEKERFLLRTPSYNSAIAAKGHNSPIVSISKLSFSESNDNSLHFVSIAENGILIIWAINEVKEESNDLGLSQTTNYKINQISVVECLKKLDLDTKTVKITALECQPNNWSNFYCGTDNGLVVRCTRHEELVNQLPKVYNKSQMNSIWTKVSAINFNKSEISNFLVGFTDGFVSYYSITTENPLIVFNSNDLPIIDVKWIANNTKDYFIALNQSNEILVWDLKSELNFKPIFRYKHLNNRLLSMSVWKGIETYLVFGCDCGQTLVFDIDMDLIEK